MIPSLRNADFLEAEAVRVQAIDIFAELDG